MGQKLAAPILDTLTHSRLERCDVYHLGTGSTRVPHAHVDDFCGNCLSTPCGRAQQDIAVHVVQRMKDLGLHRIEVSELRAIEGLIRLILQRLNRQWIQTEELSVRWMPTREHEFPKRELEKRSGVQP